MRLRALARRPPAAAPPVLEFADLRLDPFRREVYRDGRYVKLTRKQFAVLELLLRANGGVVSAETMLEKAWDEHADPLTSAPRVTMSTLRKALGEPDLIVTVPGAGYRLATVMSARLRLTLSYAAFLVAAGLMVAVGHLDRVPHGPELPAHGRQPARSVGGGDSRRDPGPDRQGLGGRARRRSRRSGSAAAGCSRAGSCGRSTTSTKRRGSPPPAA